MPRATVTLITPRPLAPKSLPEALHLRQFGLETVEGPHRPSQTPTRRTLLLGLTGAALTGAAFARGVIALPAFPQPDPRVCQNPEEVALLMAFRRLTPSERQAALTIVRALSDRQPVMLPAMPANPDAELIAACERFAFLESEYDRLCQVADWPVGHVMTAADQAVQDEFDGVSDEQHEIGEWLAEQRPQTPAGMRAKAQAVIAYGLSPSHDMISRLVASLVQNVAEERAA